MTNVSAVLCVSLLEISKVSALKKYKNLKQVTGAVFVGVGMLSIHSEWWTDSAFYSNAESGATQALWSDVSTWVRPQRGSRGCDHPGPPAFLPTSLFFLIATSLPLWTGVFVLIILTKVIWEVSSSVLNGVHAWSKITTLRSVAVILFSGQSKFWHRLSSLVRGFTITLPPIC